MSSPNLDPEEVAALRSAMLDQVARRSAPAIQAQELARPVALIAEDKSIDRARPEALRIAERWAADVRLRLPRRLGLRVEVSVEGVEVIAGAPLRDTLMHHWTRLVEIEGRAGLLLLAAGGPMIEDTASVQLGGDPKEEQGGGDPSPAALQIFDRGAGELLAGALITAIEREQNALGRSIAPPGSPSFWSSLYRADALLSLTLQVSGPTRGMVRMIVPIDSMVAPVSTTQVSPTHRTTAIEGLGDVPVVVRVELGRTTLSMRALAQLQLGQVLTLDRAIGDLLDLEIAGVVKGRVRPVIRHGFIAVELVGAPAQEKV